MNIGALIRDIVFKGRGIEDAFGVSSSAPGGAPGIPMPPPRPEGGPDGLPLPPEGTPEAPPAPAPIPEAYKSPPDLMEMYTALMDKSRNAAAMDRGMTLIAAGFAQPQNRDDLIAAAYRGGGGGSSAPSMTELLALQKYQTEQADVARQRAQLPALIEKYKLDPATVSYLDATGQLDEFITQANNPETQVITAADGSQKLVNSNTGETIKELSPAKPRETEFQKLGDGSQVLVYKDDKTRVDTGEKLTNIEAEPKPITAEKLADGTIQAIQDGKPVGLPFGPGEMTVEDLADGRKQAVVNGKPVGDPWGPKKEGEYTVTELADGTKQAIKDGKPVGKPFGPETDASTDDIKEWDTINEQRKAAGKPEVSLEDWILTRTKAGTEAGNAGPTGISYGDPPKGQAWKRDKTGAVEVDADGAPVSVWIKNSPEYAQHLKTVAETEKLTADQAAAKVKAEEDAKTDEGLATKEEVSENIFLQDIDKTIDTIVANENDLVGVTGWSGYLGSWIPGSDIREVGQSLASIKTKIGIDKLSEMRASSPTGAALGNVTEEENRMLQKAMGALDQPGSSKMLVHNLRRARVAYDLILNGIKDPSSPKAAKNGYRAPTPAEIEAAIDAIPEEVQTGEPVLSRGGNEVYESNDGITELPPEQ